MQVQIVIRAVCGWAIGLVQQVSEGIRVHWIYYVVLPLAWKMTYLWTVSDTFYEDITDSLWDQFSLYFFHHRIRPKFALVTCVKLWYDMIINIHERVTSVSTWVGFGHHKLCVKCVIMIGFENKYISSHSYKVYCVKNGACELKWCLHNSIYTYRKGHIKRNI